MSEGVDPIALVCTVIFFSLPPVVLMGISNCFRWIVLPTIIGLVGLVLFYLYPICLRRPNDLDANLHARNALPCAGVPVGLYIVLLCLSSHMPIEQLLHPCVEGSGFGEATVVGCTVLFAGLVFNMWLFRSIIRGKSLTSIVTR
uniref:Uncharacterized protein n=1 Tax=Eutreptiella gymnastica TaxID=73025 RepID=A0A7S4FFA0_9EUGL